MVARSLLSTIRDMMAKLGSDVMTSGTSHGTPSGQNSMVFLTSNQIILFPNETTPAISLI